MWSEHCAYKHSKKLLRRLPTEGPHLLMGPGENAGAVDVGDGLAIAFKVESHNHPSAVEPFQGAATGVGGILRDVFAVGARPIAVLDSLRFGELDSARSRYLLDGAVAGIGHYGNSIGVPTVGGEVYFEGPYEQNCLVNAMCLGIAREERLIRSAAAGVGNLLVLMGARTGRDGIGGASVLASAELDEDDASKRPTVQIGDPFEEKQAARVLPRAARPRHARARCRTSAPPACRPARRRWLRRARWGSTSTSSKVPLREEDMEPFEIMISESQERMLCVVEPERLAELLEICERWEVRATAIGEVTDTRRLRVLDGDEVVGDMPVEALVDDCPLYDLEPERARRRRSTRRRRARSPTDADPRERPARAARLAQHHLARSLFEQYDSSCSRARCAARSRPTPRCCTLAHDGGRARSPSRSTATGGAWPATRTPAPSRPCSSAPPTSPASGAEPLGLTNCLNFGNPEKPHVAWQLERAVAGLADACLALGVPVVGGNVSLYNEAADGPIYPTPVVGMVGRAARPRARAGAGLRERGPHDRAGRARSRRALAGSELAKLRGRAAPTGCPAIDLGATRRRSGGARRGARGRARHAPTTWPRAASPWRWPSPAWRAASARASTWRAGGRDDDRGACSARARAASWCPARAEALERCRAGHRIGTVGRRGAADRRARSDLDGWRSCECASRARIPAAFA